MARTQAVFLVLAGAMLMSFSGVFLRLIEESGAMQIIVYRAFALAWTMPFIAMILRKQPFFDFFRRFDRNDAAVGGFLCLSFSFYVYAILNTSVASALFMLAAVPFMTAFLGWFWIGEKPSRTTWGTMALALLGVTVMIWEGLGAGRVFGNVMALIAGTGFAFSLVIIRKSGKEDILGGVFIGGMCACVLNLVLGLILTGSVLIPLDHTLLALLSGVMTIGVGMGLVMWAAPHLPAAEVSLLTLLESVAAPLWVWLAFNEQVSWLVLVGGFIVLVAVSVQARFARSAKQA